MRNSDSRTAKNLLLSILAIVLTACSTGLNGFQDARGKFQISNSCIDLSGQKDTNSMEFLGSVWYEEYPHPQQEVPKGVYWLTNDPKDSGILPIDDVGQMITSPNGETAVFLSEILSDDNKAVIGTTLYYVEGYKYREVIKWSLDDFAWSPIIMTDGLLMGTYPNYKEGDNDTISVRITDLENGETRENTFPAPGLWGNLPLVGRDGILAYHSYRKDEGARLKLIDINTQKEVAQYQGMSFEMRPLSTWAGYSFNNQGTRILAIAPPQSTEPFRQELFGVEIGKTNQPIQVTDFLSKYPYILLHGHFSWSPNDRWVVIRTLLPTANPESLKPYINEEVSSSLFLIDLKKSIAYKICQEIAPKEWNHTVWSPDSKYFALSINDKIWVVDPKTLESRLLVERPGIPLQVLGWTMP